MLCILLCFFVKCGVVVKLLLQKSSDLSRAAVFCFVFSSGNPSKKGHICAFLNCAVLNLNIKHAK